MSFHVSEDQYFIVSNDSKIQRFRANKVNFISCSGSLSSIHLLDNSNIIRFTHLLKEIEQAISPLGFFRINRNELINIQHIKSFEPKQRKITMRNGTEFEVSKRKTAELRKILFNS